MRATSPLPFRGKLWWPDAGVHCWRQPQLRSPYVTFQNAANVVLDGPTFALTTGNSYQRSAADGDAALLTSWTEAGNAPGAGPTPGTAPAGTHGGCYISEIVDAAAFANEYVEIRCDATVP